MRAAIATFLLALVLFGPGVRAAGPAQNAPSETSLRGTRVLKVFNFEETALGNYESTPMFWSKVVGKGFPAFSTGGFDRSVARSADTSFRLTTEGGSVAYRFNPPKDKRLAVQGNADYYVLAFARSAQLKHARAELVAWFADEQGNLILSSEAHSQPYHPAGAAKQDDDAWQVLYVRLPGSALGNADGGKAASIVIQLGLMQPQQLGTGDTGDRLGPFAIYQQDIEGSVWFDDVTIFELPRVGVGVQKREKSPSPAGMFGPGEPVDLNIQLADLETGDASHPAAGTGHGLARLRIENGDRLVMANEEWHTPARPMDTSTGGWSQHYTHPPLPAGAYTATLDVLDEESHTPVARRQVSFLCLPGNDAGVVASPEFGLSAAGWTNAARWSELPMLLRQVGAGTIQLPGWRRDMSDEMLSRRDPQLDALLAAMQRQNVRTIGTFSEVPAPLMARLGPSRVEETGSIFSLLDSDTQIWRPFMSFPLTRYANRVDLWELGSPDKPFSGSVSDEDAPALSPSGGRPAKLYARIYGEISSLMRRPELVIPWNALFDFDPAAFPHAMLDLQMPAVIRPAQIPVYIDSFRQQGEGAQGRVHRPIMVHINGLDPRSCTRDARLADFAERLVYARIAAPETTFFDLPRGEPDELFLVYGMMAGALGGSESLGELPLTPGVHAFLFKKAGTRGGATLAMWSDAGETELALPLGASPRQSDLLGNRRTLAVDPATKLSRVRVGTMPVVVEHVEPEVLQLTASFGLSMPNIPAGQGAMQTEVVLRNPYAETLSGMLRLEMPKGWTAEPMTLPVSIAAGGTLRQEITIRYPFAEPSGIKMIRGKLQLDPGNPAGLASLDLSTAVNVSSEMIEMEAFTRFGAGGEILIQQVIRNISSATLDGEAYALVPGYPRQQRYVVALDPGQTTIKRFVFSPGTYTGEGRPLSAATAGSQAVSATLGMRQSDGRVLLTKVVPLE